MDIDIDKIIHAPFVIGLVGGFVAVAKSMPGATGGEKATNVFLGGMSAEYVTPALIEWTKITSNNYSLFAAFIVGAVSMSLAAAILQGIKETKLGEIIDSWLKRKG